MRSCSSVSDQEALATLASLRRRLPLSSAFQLQQAHGYAADPSDPHAAHVRAFTIYSGSGGADGLRCPRSEAAHGAAATSSGSLQRAALAGEPRLLAGLRTCYLAPSRFTRVGDEVLPALQAACAPVQWVEEGWDAFHDPVPPAMHRLGEGPGDTTAAVLAAAGPATAALVRSLLPDLAAELDGGMDGEEEATDGGGQAPAKRPRLARGATDPLALHCGANRVVLAGHSSSSTSCRPPPPLHGPRAWGGLPRDADGIPIAGAHTRAGAAQAAVCALNGTHARLPPGRARVLAERALFSTEDAARGGRGRPPDASLPRAAPSVALAARGIAGNEERFRELWARQDDDSDEDVPRFLELQEAVAAGAYFPQQAVAAACFEEAQFLPFVGQLRAEEGT